MIILWVINNTQQPSTTTDRDKHRDTSTETPAPGLCPPVLKNLKSSALWWNSGSIAGNGSPGPPSETSQESQLLNPRAHHPGVQALQTAPSSAQTFWERYGIYL